MFPGRCLFASMMDNSPSEELKRACKESVAHFRHIYQLDLDTIGATGESNELKRTSSVGQFSPRTSRIPTAWRWETVDLKTTYVPEFYHPQYAESRKYEQKSLFKSVSVPLIPRSPCKLVSQQSASSKTAKIIKKPAATPKHPKTLFTLWQPRIRRSIRSTGQVKSELQIPKENTSESEVSTKVQNDLDRRSRSQDAEEWLTAKRNIRFPHRSVTVDRDTNRGKQYNRENKSETNDNPATGRSSIPKSGEKKSASLTVVSAARSNQPLSVTS
ncbi:hypothetical protein D915_004055 [Fasciola hepatica]|uniref:Uncharacterized protein n=1 Tax=Fasciola hepatica TaxID=6192 RepID=A0A4E0RGL1_FASHE|nr:hypothetical protein D915_004055 [Fasciola hepatica]